jgi:hypothetical protein
MIDFLFFDRQDAPVRQEGRGKKKSDKINRGN